MIEVTKHHPYQVALDRALAAFDITIVQGLKQFWFNMRLMRMAAGAK